MDSITLAMKNRTEIKWGSADESDRKVEVLSLLLHKVKATTYDVSVPEHPTTASSTQADSAGIETKPLSCRVDVARNAARSWRVAAIAPIG